MKKIIEKIKKWNSAVVNSLKIKYQSKGWTYRKLVEDYFHLSLLYTASIIINIVLVVVLVLSYL